MIKLFVYGTLNTSGELTHCLPGYIMQRIEGKNFNFPAIVPFPYDHEDPPCVYGTVVEVSEDDLESLDVYEGVARGLNNRITEVVFRKLDSLDESVQLYVAGPALVNPIIPDGIWRK